MIETDRVTLLQGNVEAVEIPSESGKGQTIVRCPQCRIALWSQYAGSGQLVCFIRVGTLDDPDLCPPDVHIFTGSKQPWVELPAGQEASSPPDALPQNRKVPSNAMEINTLPSGVYSSR